MNRFLMLAGATTLGLALALPAQAQTNATFVLRSGERVSGDLVDMGSSGITARVSGQPRNLGMGEVAVIDFTGGSSFPSNEVSQVNGNHVLVLRDGSILNGRLVDVGGTNPKRITFSTNGTNRDFTSNEVSRIYLARPNGSPSGGTSTAGGAQGGRTLSVPANAGWVNTGITVRQGQTVLFDTEGEVRLSSDPADVASAAGSKTGRRARNAPLPGTLAGALIGRIGNGQPFGIGNQTSIPAPASGMLFLAVNDDAQGDNTGEFRVTITQQGGRVR
jgi:hypothetical protein